MAFDLPSLCLGTEFDPAVHRLSVPGLVSRDQSGPLYLLDGAVRMPRRLVQFVQPAAMLGLALADDVESVRVTVRLLADGSSDALWAQDRPGQPGPRHLAISVRGTVRALAVVAAAADGRGVRQEASLDLAGADVAGGTTVLSFSAEGTDSGLVGVLVGRIEVSRPAGPLPTTVSTGLRDGRLGETFVVNHPGGGVFDLMADPPASGPRGRMGRLASRGVRQPRATAEDPSGTAVEVGIEALPEGRGWRVRLPASPGPHRVRVEGPERFRLA